MFLKGRRRQTANPYGQDRFFLIPRILLLAGAAVWLVVTVGQMEFLLGERSQLVRSTLPLLLWFALYTAGFVLVSRAYPDRKRGLFHLATVLDVAFVTLLIRSTGSCQSNFYLAYYPFIAIEVFYFGGAAGAAVTLLSAAAYSAIYLTNPDQLFIGDFGLRLGFMFLVCSVLAALVENEKRARADLEKQRKHSNDLNSRYEIINQELIDERESQARAIEEKNRLLNEQNISAARRRSQTSFARELNAQSDVSVAAALFSRYARGLLDADRADLVLLDKDAGKAILYPSGAVPDIREIPFDHPLIQKALDGSDAQGYLELTWDSDRAHEIPDSILIDPIMPAALHIQTLTGGRMGLTGILIISSLSERSFDPDMLDELKILASHFTVAIENIALRAKLQEMADTDGLTGIFNHRYFQHALDIEIERSKRYSRPLSVILIDIDHFKKLNDTMGHQTGDAALHELAIVVKNQLRNVDTLCRYGGEEFVVILPETDASGGVGAAERIRRAIAKHTFRDTAGKAFGITISLGVGTMPPITEKKDLVKAADNALYRAKEAGRNCVAS
ncbi:MAG: sensor domain-containing diguanylate cyclase [bacterium]